MKELRCELKKKKKMSNIIHFKDRDKDEHEQPIFAIYTHFPLDPTNSRINIFIRTRSAQCVDIYSYLEDETWSRQCLNIQKS